jgi:hypothetical protein
LVDLRAFLEDLAILGWAERPPSQLLFASDVPRLDRPLPRALPSDADCAILAAVAELPDPFGESTRRPSLIAAVATLLSQGGAPYLDVTTRAV